jgi:serine O-acetyltransferase
MLGCGASFRKPTPMMNPVRFYRVARWMHLRGVPLLPKVVERLAVLIFHCWLPRGADIGGGFAVGHWGFGIVIHPRAKIGGNVFIDQGVTIGGSGGRAGVPRIGDNVFIGAGAKVLGDIEVGPGSLIGPNAVLVKSVPARTIVATGPARLTPMPAHMTVQELTGWPPRRATSGPAGSRTTGATNNAGDQEGPWVASKPD